MIPGIRFGATGSLLLGLVFFAMFTGGVQVGASADSLETAAINETAFEQNLSASLQNDSRPQDNPVVLDEFERGEKEPHPVLEKYVNGLVMQLASYSVEVANVGIAIGYANRGWISPTWVGYASRGVAFSMVLGYMVVLVQRVRRGP